MPNAAEDEFFDHEHPHGRDGLGPAPEAPLRSWLIHRDGGPAGGDGYGPCPPGWGSDVVRPHTTVRQRSGRVTAGWLRNALKYANDDDVVVVSGNEARFYLAGASE